MFDRDLRAAGRWGLLAAVALITQHLAAWPYQRYLGGFRRWVPYVLGCATLLTAFWGWAGERHQRRAARAFTLITALGGAATIGAYGLHAQHSAPALRASALPTGTRYLTKGWRHVGSAPTPRPPH